MTVSKSRDLGVIIATLNVCVSAVQAGTKAYFNQDDGASSTGGDVVAALTSAD